MVSSKATSSTLTAILITTISLTLIGTTYLFSKSLLESSTSQNFEVIDTINNKIIIRNLGNGEIREIKVLIDGKEIKSELEEPIKPYSVGTLILNVTEIAEGKHELTLITRSMSQTFEWEVEKIEGAIFTTSTSTVTTLPERIATEAVPIKKLTATSYQSTLLYVDNFIEDPSKTGWEKFGSSPYLDAVDYPENYINTTSEDGTIGNFTFSDFSDSDIIIKEVWIELRGKSSYVLNFIYPNIWDGENWTELEGYGFGSNWMWQRYNATEVLNTIEKVNNAQMWLRLDGYSGLWTAIDAARINFTYSLHAPPKLLTPDPNIYNDSNPYEVNQTETFWVNATYMCNYDTCEDVEGKIRFNSSSLPDTPISAKREDKPFYIIPYRRPSNYSTYEDNGLIENPEYAYDKEYNDTSSYTTVIVINWGGIAEINYTYSLGSQTSVLLFVRTSYYSDIYVPGRIRIYNFTGNNWYEWFRVNWTSPKTNSTSLTPSSGLVSKDGHVILNVISNDTRYEAVMLYDTYIQYQPANPISCGSMEEGEICNVSWLLNTTGTPTKAYKVDVNFTSNDLWNDTEDAVIYIKEKNPPLYFNATTNSTYAGNPINFTIEWTDDTALDSYRFYLDNCTGEFKLMDESKFPNDGKEDWVSKVYVINDTVGCTVRWKVDANDTFNNWNYSENFSFVTSSPYAWLNVSLLTPSPNLCTDLNPCKVNKTYSFPVNASVTCEGGDCGIVNATVRYNDSSGMKPVSTVEGAVPFYMTREKMIPSYAKNSTVEKTAKVNASDDIRAHEWCEGTSYCASDYLIINFSTSSSYQDVVVEGYGAKGFVYCWDGSSWIRLGELSTVETRRVFSAESCDNSDGNYSFRIFCDTGEPQWGKTVSCDVYVDYIFINKTYSNPESCGSLKEGESCVLEWHITASGEVSSAWKIDVNFSSNAATNDTKEGVVKIVDEVPPIYSDNSTNTTHTGATARFSLRWRDNDELYSYKFFFDNCWGYFKEDDIVFFDSTMCNSDKTECWSNVTKTLNSTLNCLVRWKVEASDVSNNWATSLVYSFYTTNTPPPKPQIVKPQNNTWFNKYDSSVTINCTNTTPDEDGDPLTFTIEESLDELNWNTVCSNSNGICTWYLSGVSDGTHYLRCKAYDGHEYGDYSDYVTVKIDRTPPSCILNISNITFSPYLLKGNYVDNFSGMSNVTYRYYNGSWNLIGTNSTEPYTWNWEVPVSLENEFINISATCVDNFGNNVTNQSYVAVDLSNEPPKIWNLKIYDFYGYVINETYTGRLITITVNATDSDPVRDIAYVEGNFTWPNGTMDYSNLTRIQDKPYTHFWNYTVVYYMPPGNASVRVKVVDKDGEKNETMGWLRILETVELTLENEPIDFYQAYPGGEVNALPNKGWPLKIGVGGNVPLNIYQNGTDLVATEGASINVANILWNQTEEGIFTSLSYALQRIVENLQPGNYQPVYYKLKVPIVEPYNYSGNLTIFGKYES